MASIPTDEVRGLVVFGYNNWVNKQTFLRFKPLAQAENVELAVINN